MTRRLAASEPPPLKGPLASTLAFVTHLTHSGTDESNEIELIRRTESSRPEFGSASDGIAADYLDHSDSINSLIAIVVLID